MQCLRNEDSARAHAPASQLASRSPNVDLISERILLTPGLTQSVESDLYGWAADLPVFRRARACESGTTAAAADAGSGMSSNALPEGLADLGGSSAKTRSALS